MNTGLISARYAKALLEFVKDTKSEEKVYANIKILSQSFLDEPKLISVLSDPIISYEKKLELITLAAGGVVCEEFLQFIKLILKNRREDQLHWIILKFRGLYRTDRNIFTGKLITAVAWDEQAINKFKKIILDGREGTVEFDYIIDENIIGGFIFENDSERLDASVTHQIQKLKKEFVKRNKRIV